MNYIRMKNDDMDNNSNYQETNNSGINTKSINTNAMIFANLQGEVTYMNSAAQRLTGWSMKDASKINCDEVFQIYDLETNESIDNPVESVIENDSKIGLTDNILLESKDRLKFEIEFKASPKYSDEGEMNRVILTFREIRQIEKVSDEEFDGQENLEATKESEVESDAHDISDVSFNDIDNVEKMEINPEKVEISMDVKDSDNEGSEYGENEVEALELDKPNDKKQTVYTISSEDIEEPDFLTG